MEAAYRYQLGPSGVSLEALREAAGRYTRGSSNALPQVCRAGRRSSSRLSHTDPEDRTVLRDDAGAWLPTAA